MLLQWFYVGLSIYGSTDPYFIKRGESVTAAYYCDNHLPFAQREAQILFGERKFVFKQNGAPALISAIGQN